MGRYIQDREALPPPSARVSLCSGEGRGKAAPRVSSSSPPAFSCTHLDSTTLRLISLSLLLAVKWFIIKPTYIV